jgi:hypothetical protein
MAVGHVSPPWSAMAGGSLRRTEAMKYLGFFRTPHRIPFSIAACPEYFNKDCLHAAQVRARTPPGKSVVSHPPGRQSGAQEPLVTA